jgi:hypothetical protein
VLAVGIVIAIAARVGFWLYADRVWEDALITIEHARNALRGIGLTHHPGEGVVHGFTSAVSVLIPLAAEFLVEGSAMFVMRIASIVASVATIVFAYLIARRLEITTWPLAFLIGYLALAQNHVFFGMAGMETQIAVAVLLGGGYFVITDRERVAGVALGIAALTRPEFGLWVVIGLALIAIRGLKPLLRALLPVLLVIFPWVVFTTVYYGSFVPHTILAKSAVPFETFPGLEAMLETRLLAAWKWFAPFYENGFTVDAPLWRSGAWIVAMCVIVLAVRGAWRLRRNPDAAPFLAFALAFLVYKILLIPSFYSEWYLPPFTAVVALFAAAGLQSLRTELLRDGIVVGLIASLSMHMPYSWPVERIVQRDVENEVRRTTSLFLAENVPPREAVVAEPAGYLGYYSDVLLWDFPGLTSPHARSVISTRPYEDRSYPHFILDAAAPWMALRIGEWEQIQSMDPAFASQYTVRGSIVSAAEADGQITYGGLTYRSIDMSFVVLERVDE